MKILLAAVTAVSIGLSGCITDINQIPTDLQTWLNNVETSAASVCGWLPTDLNELISIYNSSAGATAGAVAAAICAEIPTPTPATMASIKRHWPQHKLVGPVTAVTVTVNGNTYVVHGQSLR